MANNKTFANTYDNIYDGLNKSFEAVSKAFDRRIKFEQAVQKACDDYVDEALDFDEVQPTAIRFEKTFTGVKTIVEFKVGPKTTVICNEKDFFDPYTGIMMCLVKKLIGTKNFRKWCSKMYDLTKDKETVQKWREKVKTFDINHDLEGATVHYKTPQRIVLNDCVDLEYWRMDPDHVKLTAVCKYMEAK